MESRYLAATLALVATFGILSHEFRTGHLATVRDPQQVVAALKCGGSALASRVLGKVQSKLRPDLPEEAQMLAEMNLPFAQEQALANEHVAQDATIAAMRAQQNALQASDRARQAAQRAMQKAARQHSSAKATSYEPISVEVNLPGDLQRQIDLQTADLQRRIDLQTAAIQRRADLQAAALQRRIAQTIRIHVASAKLARLTAGVKVDPVLVMNVVETPESGGENCAVSQRTRQIVRQQVRDVLHQVEVNFTTN